MILSDAHIELLKQIRPKIEESTGHSYICVAFEFAALDYFEVEQLEDDQEAYFVVRELTNAIHDSLGGKATMLGYLLNHIWGFDQLPMQEKRDLSNLARLAWIDKMLETRTIV